MGGQSLRAPTADIPEREGPTAPSERKPSAGGYLFYFGALFIEKTARSSRSSDGPSWAASNTAIESFWRWIFVKIWPFLLDAMYRP